MEDDSREILFLDEIDSTQQYSIENIDRYFHGQVIMAERQTLGRGRMERKWLSESSHNLYMSIILKPSLPNFSDLPLASLTQLMSLSICNFLTSVIPLGEKIKPYIKWPNDVFLNRKKIAGILSQAVFDNDVFKGVVLGMGFNVFLTEEEISAIDQPATGLKNEINLTIDKKEIAFYIIKDFFNKYNPFLENGFSLIKDSYLDFFPFIGCEIEVQNSAHRVVGRVKNISDAGTLILENNCGKNINISMGDMQCLKKV